MIIPNFLYNVKRHCGVWDGWVKVSRPAAVRSNIRQTSILLPGFRVRASASSENFVRFVFLRPVILMHVSLQAVVAIHCQFPSKQISEGRKDRTTDFNFMHTFKLLRKSNALTFL